MYDLDMETTKLAAICGYAGRLFYIDEEGSERVMVVKPEESILLYRTEMTEPLYAVRYYTYNDLSDVETAKAEFYDQANVTYFSGTLNHLTATGKTKPHLYDFCPLQGIPNNRELIGDAEKVIALIDDYDKNFSDNSNDLESFANTYMVYENVRPDEETMELMDKSGAIAFESVNAEAPSKVYFLTKNLDGGFSNQHLDREEDNTKETTENREKQRDRQEEGIAKSMGSDIIDVKKEMTSQLGRLTEEEKEAVTRYTGFQAQKVNSAIAAGRVTSADEKYMSVLDSALEKGVVTKDITVHRKTIPEYMNLPFDAKKLTPTNVRILLGQTITNNTYTSTSLTDFEYPGRNVFFDLLIPKGYKGALYIKTLAYKKFKNQEEVLFARGLSYKIMDAVFENGICYITAEVVKNG